MSAFVYLSGKKKKFNHKGTQRIAQRNAKGIVNIFNRIREI
jgi:hypothetical protein